MSWAAATGRHRSHAGQQLAQVDQLSPAPLAGGTQLVQESIEPAHAAENLIGEGSKVALGCSPRRSNRVNRCTCMLSPAIGLPRSCTICG
jgi:hypothetical protein